MVRHVRGVGRREFAHHALLHFPVLWLASRPDRIAFLHESQRSSGLPTVVASTRPHPLNQEGVTISTHFEVAQSSVRGALLRCPKRCDADLSSEPT